MTARIGRTTIQVARLRPKRAHVILLVLASCAFALDAQQQLPHVKDTVLYRLFDQYPYDTKKPFALQYPRVALTVVSAPPNHAQLQQHDFGGGFIPGNGCWTLRAKVWSDAKTSQDVGPFQW